MTLHYVVLKLVEWYNRTLFFLLYLLANQYSIAIIFYLYIAYILKNITRVQNKSKSLNSLDIV